MKPLDYSGLVRISHHLTWLERFVCITSGLSLTVAVIIAGGDMSLIGRSLPFLGVLQAVWILCTVLATDTQYIASLSAFSDALRRKDKSAALGWLFIVVILVPPAAAVNIAFALVTAGLANDDIQAVHMLGISPFVWVASRGGLGIFLVAVSCLTRPWADQKIAEPEPLTIRQPEKAVKRPPQGARTSVRGRSKRTEVAMGVWREAEAERLYRHNTRISIRALASGLTYADPKTGKSYPCAMQTAAELRRDLRSTETATTEEGIAA